MTLTVRMSGSWNYRGRRSSHRTEKTFDHPAQARAYVRKVIAGAREDAGRRWTRNSGKRITYISVWPEGAKVGDVVDVWNLKRGWHKGEVYNRSMGSVLGSWQELRARSLPERTVD